MKRWLQLGVSVLLIAGLLTLVVDVRELGDILKRLSPTYLLLALAVVTVDRFLMTYKWTLLLKAQGYRLPLLRGVTIYCTSMLWGSALPATIGADAIRAVLVTRCGYDGTNVVISIVIERVIGFVLALLLGVASLAILRMLGVLDADYDRILYLGILLFAGTLAAIVVSLNERLMRSVVAQLPARARDSRAMQTVGRFGHAYRALGAARGTIGAFAALTALEQVFSVLFPWVIALGLNVDVELLLLLGVLPLSTLLSRLPISFDGIGVFESIFVGLLMLAGVAAEPALAIALAGRFIQLIAFFPWWLVHVSSTGAIRPPQGRNAEGS